LVALRIAQSNLNRSGVPAGKYVVELYSAEYYYPSLRVDVGADGENVHAAFLYTPGIEWAEGDAPVAAYPLQFGALSLTEIHQDNGFKVSSLLANPMVLMMLFGAGMMYIMPKLMENLGMDETSVGPPSKFLLARTDIK
jgi:hypothetical protein